MSVSAFVDELIDARRQNAPVNPTAEPANHAEAYEAQRLTGERLGVPVAGWKVADHPKIGPIAAPIFGDVSLEEGATWPVAPGLGVEIEVALWLNRDLPTGTYSREAIAAAIESYAVGVELVRTRLIDPQRNLFAFLGDLMVNAGYVMGAPQKPMMDYAVPERRCLLSIGGQSRYDAPCAPPPLDPLAVIAAWLTRADDQLGGLKAGQYVTTGSVCGIIPISHKGKARAEITGLGVVTFDLT